MTPTPNLPESVVRETERCRYCDDTGDVHGIDGEFRGRCSCPAGAPFDDLVQTALEAYADVFDGMPGSNATAMRAALQAVITDLRAANARAEGWLPIESAPKNLDGPVMGFGEYRERDGFSPAFMRWYPIAEGWFVNSMPFYPTHWQPLPQPPIDAAQAVRSEASEGER